MMMYHTAVQDCRARRLLPRFSAQHRLANNKWFTIKYAVVLATDVDVKSVQIVVFAT